MEQPTSPTALPPAPSTPKKHPSNNDTNATKRQRPPTPEELVALYEAHGLDTKEASLKAIGDLQAALYRTVVSARTKRDRFTTDTARKLDNVNTRLAMLEMKLDGKPDLPQSFAIGVASGAALHGIGTTLPHVLGALGSIWVAVKTATGSAHSPPSSSS